MDPLSGVLSLLQPRNYLSAGVDAGGDWSIRFAGHNAGVKCGAIVSGECWLSVEGVSEPVHLQTGDGFLLPAGRPFCLASDLALPPTEASQIFSGDRNGALTTYQGGGKCFAVSCRFTLAGDHADIIAGLLPPLVHMQTESDRDAIRWFIERMHQELQDGQPGSFLIVQHLAHMILLQALRLSLAGGAGGGIGWLAALADQQIGPTIRAIHDDPGHRWTLQELAARAGMSRSAFVLKFRETAGTSPIEYLTRWRMRRAADRLVHSADSVAAIAASLGYESESAFNTAFKRVMGCSPRQYARRQAAAPAPLPSQTVRETPLLSRAANAIDPPAREPAAS